MDDEKRLTLEYGDGARFIIRKSQLPKAMKTAEELKEIAKRPGSGYTPAEAEKMYTLRIVKDEK